MPSRLELVKTPEASIPTANPGEVNFFIEFADGLAKSKDENDIVLNLSGSSADEINNASANPVITNAGAEPAAVGLVMATTTIGPPHTGAFVDPRPNLVSTTVRQLIAPVDAAANHNAALDELVRMDPATFGADQTVTLPAVGGAIIDREIWVKIIAPVGGFKVSIVGAISFEVDGLANADPDLDLTTDRAWMKLRGNLEGTAWLIVG